MSKRYRRDFRMNYAFSAPVSSKAGLALIIMCHFCGESGLYRKGHEYLGERIGRPTASPAARSKVVQRAIRELTEAGYIEEAQPPRRGQPPIYRIRFED